ncbi:MAG TPA: alpha/beta fold hydrolase [Actinomycetes bacterium]
MATTATMGTVDVDGIRVAYRELGTGPAVLLLHGWPTSSQLWREVMVPVARSNRAVAVDLPGFGASDKPLDRRYGFDLFERTIELLLAQLGIGRTAIAVHDLGGPVGVRWAIRNPQRVTRLALLNTLLYPEFSEALLEFVKVLSDRATRGSLTSPEGLESVMRLGLADQSHLTDELLEAVREPFRTEESRRALAHAGIQLELEGFAEIGRRLHELRVPVRIVYGARDQLLPDVAETMARAERDLPQAVTTVLPDCGHFLQLEAPRQVGELLARFFAEAD